MSKKLSTQEKARRLWVRALRSGKYEWGKNHLHPTDDRYCCLGVLCEIAIKQGIIESYLQRATGLPDKVRLWAGLDTAIGDFSNKSLAEINDDATRNPFKKIANLIEKKPEGLFVERDGV